MHIIKSCKRILEYDTNYCPQGPFVRDQSARATNENQPLTVGTVLRSLLSIGLVTNGRSRWLSVSSTGRRGIRRGGLVPSVGRRWDSPRGWRIRWWGTRWHGRRIVARSRRWWGRLRGRRRRWRRWGRRHVSRVTRIDRISTPRRWTIPGITSIE